ncbi:hypothetical protein MMC07_000657 [Pseudocyphellaria aurata]|nr:hypothetical protein [Pseudocyphellaria aurata]
MDVITSNLRHLSWNPIAERKTERKAAKEPPPSPSISYSSSLRTLRSHSSSRRSSSIHHALATMPHTDELPTSITALEGMLNHHASQLQQLADRVEAVNEWIDLDEIVVARMSAEKDKSGGRQRKDGREKVSRMEGKIKGQKVVSFSGKHEKSEENGPGISCGVLEARKRILAMRQWRKELEHSVCWQREEYWRIEHAMGRKGCENMGGGEGGGAGAMDGTVGRKWNSGSEEAV